MLIWLSGGFPWGCSYHAYPVDCLYEGFLLVWSFGACPLVCLYCVFSLVCLHGGFFWFAYVVVVPWFAYMVVLFFVSSYGGCPLV